jgi:hypothetical protein
MHYKVVNELVVRLVLHLVDLLGLVLVKVMVKV